MFDYARFASVMLIGITASGATLAQVKSALPATLTPQVAANSQLPVSPQPSMTSTVYPTANSVSYVGTDVVAQGLTNVPMPTIQVSQIDYVKTVMVPKAAAGGAMLDVSVLDDFITYLSPMARHYPPVFNSRTERFNATERLESLTTWIDGYAKDPNASYEVLIRAAKINAMGRNLDLGSDYAVRASQYVERALRLSDTAEANFIYGVMLAEGGGFQEGSKYLEKAEKMGYAEATQSLAQADLLSDNRAKAIQRLTQFKAKYPNDPYIDAQLAIVNGGEFYIWKLPEATLRRKTSF